LGIRTIKKRVLIVLSAGLVDTDGSEVLDVITKEPWLSQPIKVKEETNAL
jgi:hypothetical protein